MKAMVQDEYGPPGVVGLREIENPEIEDDQGRIRVHATAVNADWATVRGRPYVFRLVHGLRRPRNGGARTSRARSRRPEGR